MILDRRHLSHFGHFRPASRHITNRSYNKLSDVHVGQIEDWKLGSGCVVCCEGENTRSAPHQETVRHVRQCGALTVTGVLLLTGISLRQKLQLKIEQDIALSTEQIRLNKTTPLSILICLL